MTAMMLSRDELNWIQTQPEPDHHVPVFVNMSCGTQFAPHLSLETVNIFRALGVDVVAGLGRQFCCGKIYRVNDQSGAGERMSQASLDHFREWGASTAVHHCPSCQIVFSDYAAKNPDAAPGLTNKHFSTFLEERLLELGDKVPWKKKVNARVLIEAYGFDTITPVHAEVANTAARIVRMVPGAEYMGVLEMPSQGAACLTLPSGLQLTTTLSPSEVSAMQDELRAQLRARGANVISPVDKFCQREWSKLSEDDLPVRHYLSIVAEALGCAEPDRFQKFWRMHDTSAVVEAARPYWSSWGMQQKTAEWLAVRQFDSSHTGVEPKCGCGGDSTKCTTGKFTLAKREDIIQIDRSPRT
jgi:Fe-S oxidoreductase